MDELTRERFWPRPLPPPIPDDDVIARQMVLVGYDNPDEKRTSAMQEARLRAEALLRSKRLTKAIKAYEVKRNGENT